MKIFGCSKVQESQWKLFIAIDSQTSQFLSILHSQQTRVSLPWKITVPSRAKFRDSSRILLISQRRGNLIFISRRWTGFVLAAKFQPDSTPLNPLVLISTQSSFVFNYIAINPPIRRNYRSSCRLRQFSRLLIVLARAVVTHIVASLTVA